MYRDSHCRRRRQCGGRRGARSGRRRRAHQVEKPSAGQHRAWPGGVAKAKRSGTLASTLEQPGGNLLESYDVDAGRADADEIAVAKSD